MNFFSLIAVIHKVSQTYYYYSTVFRNHVKNINTSQELEILVVKECQHNSLVKGFHVYKEIRNPVQGEVLDTRMEPENPTNKYTVCVENNGRMGLESTSEFTGQRQLIDILKENLKD